MLMHVCLSVQLPTFPFLYSPEFTVQFQLNFTGITGLNEIKERKGKKKKREREILVEDSVSVAQMVENLKAELPGY